MKPLSIIFLCFLLIIWGQFQSIAADAHSENSDYSENSEAADLYRAFKSLKLYESSPRRSLLSDDSADRKPDVNMVAFPDGTLFFTDPSRKRLWKFASGPSISNMYQADVDADAVADSDDDSDKTNTLLLDGDMKYNWDDNYVIERADLGEETLSKMVADYVSTTPHISKDGITLGGKRTTVFLVDSKDGSLINAFKLEVFPPRLNVPSDGDENALFEHATKKLVESSPTDPEKVELLYITRTDYLLQSCAPATKKVLWNLTVSQIQASYLHPEKTLEVPVAHARDIKFVRFLLDIFKLNYTDAKLLLGPETGTALVVSGTKDRNSMPLAIAGSADDNSLSPANTSDVNQNSPFPHSNLMSNMILCLLVVILAFGLSYTGIITITRRKSTKQLNDSNGNHSVAPKRRKARKLGNYNGSNIRKNENISSEDREKSEGLSSTGKTGKEPWNTIPADAVGANGRMVGKLFISNIEIAKGSNGTVVLEGKYDGRPVAVKRLVQAHHGVAYKEIQNLIASDRHPNIVRWYGVEYDSDFVYLALERCTCSLYDLVQTCTGSSRTVSTKGKIMSSVHGYNIQLDSAKGVSKEVELWKANGYPSSQLLKLMRDVISGLAHLHELGIIHRDLKPQNILIINERSLCAKLSDMGISKRLLGDKASLGIHPTGFGSSGWQAPEQLLHGRQTRAVDLFSLGCVLFFCMTGGKHPYGDHLERDINIVKNRVDLFMVEHIPEAVDLFSRLLDPNPELRPTALDVMHHPLFWSSEMRLSFLRDASDRVELEDRENGSNLLKELESVAPVALGGKWDEKMESTFLSNIGRYRRYKFDSARDLLRVMRNKLNHYRELPKDIQELLGSIPEGFDGYFTSRFPKFLIEVYKVFGKYCREEECFWKYFRSNLE